MKKVTQIVTLVATGLCALALVPATAAISAVVADNGSYHGITYISDNEVYVNAPVAAKAGKTVDITLDFDDEAYEIYGCVLNDTELVAQTSWEGHNFSFVMPDEEAVIEIVGASLMEPENYPVINVNADKGIVLNNVSGTGYTGYYEIFSVGSDPDSAYQWDGTLRAYKLNADGSEGAAVLIMRADQTNFAVMMPDCPIAIEAGAERKGVLLTYTYAEYGLLDSIKYLPEGDGADWVEVDIDHAGYVYKEGMSYSYMIPAGLDVQVTLKSTSVALPTALMVGDEKLENADGSLVYNFKMPVKDTALAIEKDTLYRKISFREGKADNYNWSIYVAPSSSGEYVKRDEFKAVYGEYVRLYPTPKDASAPTKIKNFKAYVDGALNSYPSLGSDERGQYIQFSVTAGDYEFDVTEEYVGHTIDLSASTEHVQAKLVVKDGDNWVEKNPAVVFYGDYVYIQFVVSSPDYGVSNPKLVDEDEWYTSNLSVFDADNNVYKTTSTLADYNYILKFTELSKKFANYDFVGTYVGFNPYSANGSSANTSSSSYSPVIDEYGTFKKYATSSTVHNVSADGENTVKTGKGSFIITKANGTAKKAYYNGKWFVSDDDFDYDILADDYVSLDFLVAYKQEGVKFNYRNYGAKGTAANLAARNWYTVVEARDADNNVIDRLLIVRTSTLNGVFMDGVTFEFTTGSHCNESTAVYTIKVNGTPVVSVNKTTATVVA